MNSLKIEASKYTPYISFDPVKNYLEMRGESYPENTAEFFAPVLEWVQQYFSQVKEEQVSIDLEIIYFNSSSSKILMDFFDFLEEESVAKKKIEVNWIYDPENDSAKEYGEEFKEDLETLTFKLVPKESN